MNSSDQANSTLLVEIDPVVIVKLQPKPAGMSEGCTNMMAENRSVWMSDDEVSAS